MLDTYDPKCSQISINGDVYFRLLCFLGLDFSAETKELSGHLMQNNRSTGDTSYQLSHFTIRGHRPKAYAYIIIIIRQPLCPVVGGRPQHAVSKLPCLVLSSAISCRSSIWPGRLSIAWLVSLVVFSCHMVSNW